MLKRCLGAFVALAFGLSATAARADEVIVFAAASLTNALNEIGESFTAKTGHTVKPSYAASSALAKQVEQGSPAHVFASATSCWTRGLAASLGSPVSANQSGLTTALNSMARAAPLRSSAFIKRLCAPKAAT